MTIEEENELLRDLIEKHIFNQMNLCSQTLRDLRKVRAMDIEMVSAKPPVNTSSRVYW